MPSINPEHRSVYSSSEHRKMRALLIKTTLPSSCPFCGGIMTEDMELDLDHSTPLVEGGMLQGGDRLAHRKCNQRAGAHLSNERRRRASDLRKRHAEELAQSKTAGQSAAAPPDLSDQNSSFPVPPLPALSGNAQTTMQPAALGGAFYVTPESEKERTLFEQGLPESALNKVLNQPWIAEILPMPESATLPRLMSGVHPDATGSYGELAEKEAKEYFQIELRWFQRLTLRRILEHDADGNLVWMEALVTAARQVGKSYLLRALGLFRMRHPELFGGEPQLVVMTSQTLEHAKAVLQPGIDLAMNHQGIGWSWTLRAESAGFTVPVDVDAGDRVRTVISRWRISALNSVTGLTVNTLMVDEAWQASAEAIRSRAKPAIIEAAYPQMILTSTAATEGENRATPVIPAWRAGVLADLEHATRLLLEWSASPDVQGVGTLEDWRQASPHWSRQREMIMQGESEDRSPRNVAAFRSQYLNIWPKASATEAETLITAKALIDATTADSPAIATVPVIAVEDWHGNGAAVALAHRQPNGITWVTGDTFPDRTAALTYARRFIEKIAPESILLLGASMESDPLLDDFPSTPELRGTKETRRDILLYRRLVKSRQVAHDWEASELRDQIAGAEVIVTDAGVRFSMLRHDLAQAAVWAVCEAARNGEADEMGTSVTLVQANDNDEDESRKGAA